MTQFFRSSLIPTGAYTKNQIFQLLGINYGGYSINQLYLGTNDTDYAERTYIWGSTKFKLADDVIFVVNQDGSREIRNFAIVPDGNEDFDFSGGPVSSIGNAALEPIIDPSSIGRRVEMIFTGINKIQKSTFTAVDFTRDEKTVVTVNEIDKVTASLKGLYAVEKLVTTLFSSGTQSIRFLDAENRPIIYGTDGNDSILGYITPANVNLDQDEYNVKGWAGSILDFGLNSRLYPYRKNGVAYVTGDGNDSIIGTDHNDVLIGGEGQDDMDGGAGNDTFYIQGTDTDYDVFNGGKGQDTISGSQKGDTIRVRVFSGEDTVEVIDGGGVGAGEKDILAGTDLGYHIDIAKTRLIKIHEINLGSGADTLCIDSKTNPFDATLAKIDGGTGEDSLSGSMEKAGIDANIIINAITVTGIEHIYTGSGDDTIHIHGTNTSVDGLKTIRAGDGKNTITLENAPNIHFTLETVSGGSGQDTITFSDLSNVSIQSITLGGRRQHAAFQECPNREPRHDNRGACRWHSRFWRERGPVYLFQLQGSFHHVHSRAFR